MNWKRGLHRVYTVLVVLWCLWAQNWVREDHWSRVNLDLKLAESRLESDQKPPGTGDIFDRIHTENVSPAVTAADKQKLAQASAVANMNAWKAIFSNPSETWFFFGVMLIPPIAVYLAIVGLIFLVRWLVRGFKPAAESK